MLFFKELLDRIPTSKAPDAHVLLLATISRSKLKYGDLEGAKVDMDEAWKILDDLSDVESRVRAAYYHIAAAYYKVRPSVSPHLKCTSANPSPSKLSFQTKGDYSPYYKNSLLYLACIDIKDLGEEERLVRSHDLAISAFLGDTIYNFGELVRSICYLRRS